MVENADERAVGRFGRAVCGESGGVWTSDAARAWERDGCVVFEDVVSAEDCEALLERGRALHEQTRREGKLTGAVFGAPADRDAYFLESGQEIRFFFEEGASGDGWEGVNKVGHALHDRDAVFDRFSRRRVWEEVVRGVGLEDPRLVQSMLILKHPSVGGEVGWHQDNTYLRTEPDTTVGLWFALEDATVENGCLWAVLGAHRAPVAQRYERVDGRGAVLRQVCVPSWDVGHGVPLEVSRGSLVVLHGSLPHGSEANRSKKARPAYAMHLVDGRASWSPRNWLRVREPFRGF